MLTSDGARRPGVQESAVTADVPGMTRSQARLGEAAAPDGLLSLTAPDGDLVLCLSPSGRLLGASRSVVELLGWDLQACAQQGVLGGRRGHRRARGAASARQAGARHRQRALDRAGRPGVAGRLWLDVAAKQLVDQPGAPLWLSARDVTDDVAAATQLAASEQQWRVAFEQSPIGGALLDLDGGVLVANDALRPSGRPRRCTS